MKIDWLNRLGKWRSVFAGWQLGTRLDAVQDLQDYLSARAEAVRSVDLLLGVGGDRP